MNPVGSEQRHSALSVPAFLKEEQGALPSNTTHLPPPLAMVSTKSSHYVRSILDTDLYKASALPLTMQQAVLRHFPEAQVEYRFTNRSKGMKFNTACVEAIVEAINRERSALQDPGPVTHRLAVFFVGLEDISLTKDERSWLQSNCTYFRPEYLDYLQKFRFRPKEQVTVRYLPALDNPGFGDLEFEFRGLWAETILYETPVMAIVSEAYFNHVDTDWSLAGTEELAYQKGKILFQGGIALSEFGARRRRSYDSQKLVIEGLLRAHREFSATSKGRLAGTSNVHFAHMFNLMPIGTIAHEWTMGIAAVKGYEQANLLALELWEDVYPTTLSNSLHIALTDTFTSPVFFNNLLRNPGLAARWRGLRQDSGNPLEFIPLAKAAYEKLGINPKDKLVVFSDSLDVDLCLKIKAASDEVGFQSSFGVGTSLTNDFKKLSNGEKSKPLNIVIKLGSIDGNECIKISDDIMKNTGDKAAVRQIKEILGIPVLTMQQAVLRHFPKAQVGYKFWNRSTDMKFNTTSIDAIVEAINGLEDVSLTKGELTWLQKNCTYFRPEYLDYLQKFRFRSKEQVTIRYLPSLKTPEFGDLEMEFQGLWAETILYETPVMAIVNEAYFNHVDKDWTLAGAEEIAYQKGKSLFQGGIALSEFGARRRRSYDAQKLVIEGLLRAHREFSAISKGRLDGTSNVHFAQMFNLMPVGAIAHEWTMGVGAARGYERANLLALELWDEVYPTTPSNSQHIALTDTFTSPVFFKNLLQNPGLALQWRGLRQDSGNPLDFIPQAKATWQKLGVNPRDKLLVFSDSLDLDACFKIKKACDEEGLQSAFGVGTFLTNDFKKLSNGEKSMPICIVIKIGLINGKECIKIGDDITRNTGDEATMRAIKELLGVPITSL
ncbi:nicotinate phosphoribosyltransferase [Tulasnella sp. 417]|nr:nicotinate phosphoribosyltransferase [Tulasnella sp. 417]